MQPLRNNHQVSKVRVFEKLVKKYDGVLHEIMMITSNENDQANRVISTGKLHGLRHFHTQPINVVVFHDSDREN